MLTCAVMFNVCVLLPTSKIHADVDNEEVEDGINDTDLEDNDDAVLFELPDPEFDSDDESDAASLSSSDCD